MSSEIPFPTNETWPRGGVGLQPVLQELEVGVSVSPAGLFKWVQQDASVESVSPNAGLRPTGPKGYSGLCFCSLERVSAQVSSVFVCLEDAPPFLALPSLLSFLVEYDKALRRHFSRIITLSWWLDK